MGKHQAAVVVGAVVMATVVVMECWRWKWWRSLQVLTATAASGGGGDEDKDLIFHRTVIIDEK